MEALAAKEYLRERLEPRPGDPFYLCLSDLLIAIQDLIPAHTSRVFPLIHLEVYFPRLIVPMAAVGVAFVDFIINFTMLVALMIWYKFVPGWQIIFLPLFVGLALIAGLGPGLWLTALNVKYRDVRYIIPFLVQLGLYVSPVGYSSNIVPDQWRLLYSLNPVVGVIDGFRWCILGRQSQFYLPGFLLSVCIVMFFLWLGVRQFRKMEKGFADLM